MVVARTSQTLEEDNEMLRVINHQFKAKYENNRAFFGGRGGKVKLKFRTKTTRAVELQRRFNYFFFRIIPLLYFSFQNVK